MTTVMLYCAQPVLAAGFQAVLANLDDFGLSAVCSSVGDLMVQVQAQHPNVILVEATPEITLEAVKGLRFLAGNAAVILWADAVTTEFASQAMALGVRGVLRKSLSLELQAKCLVKVAAGELWIEKALSDKLLSTKRIALTPRERQLVGLIAQGLKNKEIAYSLGITEGTVKVYLSRLFQKIGVNDRFELALFALKNLYTNQAGDTGSSKTAAADTPGPAAFFVPSFMTVDRVRV